MEQLNKVELRGVVGSVRLQKIGNTQVANFTVATSIAYKDRSANPIIETKKDETEPQLVPCCGCGGWSLVRVIGEPAVEAKGKKPATVLEPDDILTFGKYKGRKVIDVYCENSQYLQWAEGNVKDFLVNWQALMRVHRGNRNQSPADNQTYSEE